MNETGGYAWVRNGRIRAVAMTPDIEGDHGERIDIPRDTALAFLRQTLPLTACVVMRDNTIIRADDPAIFSVGEGSEPMVRVADKTAEYPIRIRLRVGHSTRRLQAALETDVRVNQAILDMPFTVVGTRDDEPVFGQEAKIADLLNAGGVEWPLPADIAPADLVLYVPAYRGVVAWRTEDGDDLPIRTDVLTTLMPAIPTTSAPDQPCLLLTRKRRTLSVAVHAGGGRRYSSPPALLPIVVTVAGDPSMILHGEKVATEALLAGKIISVKLPASVARVEVDVLVGRLFERAMLIGVKHPEVATRESTMR